MCAQRDWLLQILDKPASFSNIQCTCTCGDNVRTGTQIPKAIIPTLEIAIISSKLVLSACGLDYLSIYDIMNVLSFRCIVLIF